MAILTPSEVRVFIKDVPTENHLLDAEEFSDTEIALAMELAVGEWNLIPPISYLTVDDFPNKALLLSGTLYKMFSGRTALLARNTMNYSDGGLTVPVEERAPLYQALAGMYQADFQTGAQRLKMHLNIESGWGGVASDYITFPTY